MSKVERTHYPGRPCPIKGGGPIEVTFTDHSRPGVFNACKYCHEDQRTVAQRLRDLEEVREQTDAGGE